MNFSNGNQRIELFIIDNDPSITTKLRNYLQMRFGALLTISTFNTGTDALQAITKNTEIVVLENYLTGESGSDIHRSLKKKNQRIQIVPHVAHSEIGDTIEIYSNGVRRDLRRKIKKRKLFTPIYKAITYPIKFIAKEFKITKFLGFFLVSFFLIGVIVFAVMWILIYSV